MSRAMARLQSILGAKSAQLLCERLGGRVVYVPAVPSASSRLVLALGHAASAKLAIAMPGTKLLVPSPKSARRARIRDAVKQGANQGLPPSEIASRHGITTRYVQILLKEPN